MCHQCGLKKVRDRNNIHVHDCIKISFLKIDKKSVMVQHKTVTI